MTALEAIALAREVRAWFDSSHISGIIVVAYPARRLYRNADSHWLIEFRIGAQVWGCSTPDAVNDWLTRLATNGFDDIICASRPLLLSSLARKS